jgi:3-hydroxybutyryl-CoA dehydrogenase
MEVLRGGLGDERFEPAPLLREHVAAGRLGRKSGTGFYTY